jgi:hypothetical protein
VPLTLKSLIFKEGASYFLKIEKKKERGKKLKL